ncbi:helix-turn-helix domain-containing protein [Cohnella thailandensis]|uniref:Helix-turn-helix domain-containing protein n=1 Tax=Cohnella thailandensis TaxID=557557 RepID=A0A841T407_9BACL|nr:helix-turn-helix domain-containing protein [Cohnella thailandensis]MBB6636800.1 helix-turn-helix domain-containing protein [Cohnella thailandensis]MBP1973323.1 AraC-like DNA-binding protein [Cohnella thailandensis]
MREWAERIAEGSITITGVFKNIVPAESEMIGNRVPPSYGSYLLFTLRGQAELLMEEGSRTLHSDTIISGGPGLKPVLRSGSLDYEYCLIFYTLRSGAGRGVRRLNEDAFEIPISNGWKVVELLRKLHHVAGLPGPMSAFRSKELFYSVLHEVCNDTGVEKKKVDKSIMEQSIQFINDRFREPLTLRELANLHGMGMKSFTEMFTRYTGVRPMIYLEQRRMKKAEELLATSDSRVSEIARSVGYSDPTLFHKLFRKYTGNAPDVYRESGEWVQRSS